MEFKLPDIGEGVHEGEIVKWLVKEGDKVTEDQPLVEVMTDKATVEIPSPVSGVIFKLHYKEGAVVQVESVIVSIDEKGGKKEKAQKKETVKKNGHPERIPSEGGGERRISSPEKTGFFGPKGPQNDHKGPIRAMPATRQLAKEKGINLFDIFGTGKEGLITPQDVLSFSKGSGISGGVRFQPIPIPSMGPEERVPLRGIRKTIATRLQMSKHYAPHFSYIEEIDVTELVRLRNAKKYEAEKQGVKLTYLAYILKGLIPALEKFPALNASLDETTGEIVYKKYFHLGIAVATPDGLLVPVIRDLNSKSLLEVATEIVRCADLVKQKKASPEDLKGSSFTVTSIGSIGGVFATPIINYPDVAILGVNKIVERPVIYQGKIVPRQILYLSLTLDHRVVDGAVAAEFMNKFKEILETPEAIQ